MPPGNTRGALPRILLGEVLFEETLGMKKTKFYYAGAEIQEGDVVWYAGEIGTIKSISLAEPKQRVQPIDGRMQKPAGVYDENSRPAATVLVAGRNGSKDKQRSVSVYGPDWPAMELVVRGHSGGFGSLGQRGTTFYYAGEPILLGDIVRPTAGSPLLDRVVGLLEPGDARGWTVSDSNRGVIWLRPLAGDAPPQAEPPPSKGQDLAIEPFGFYWEDMELVKHSRCAPVGP